VACKKKVDDLSENGATRLMAALAAQEIRDVFDGKGDIELAKKSLHLLLSIIAGAVPNVPTSNDKELAKPAHNKPCAAALWRELRRSFRNEKDLLVPCKTTWFPVTKKRLHSAINRLNVAQG